uniref:Phosphomannomutase/phosphoglucomutase n=2 Tax=Rhodosorus marinus TaxID=101924 RepID=A0A7S2ZXH6_9RHOD|mmetsp:Transcript_36563/g.146142  ORF Transcript_36563/g.146142 Transcript_36563/m.146142 type:complete len:575 (+) Transcript_36563:294-2018(+)|eukprot:CAMPEP_0113964470 /NCGR_PEP_ID=MMETSP0011_2-20120614/7159_1 /TAXON_ID=101924 /ORGANISM="Rhodosorus marinus" /LENGTH=574 /DNA_ID=CAMNT_0000976779 /DNA_START=263 /DNA_END=1987 /DNA_ORIENTATION=- /assembly_acc=CAM_ASM_000156
MEGLGFVVGVSRVVENRPARVIRGPRPDSGAQLHALARRCRPVMKVSSVERDRAKSSVVEAFIKVQNGSDVRGVAMDTFPEEPVTLKREYVAEIASSFARWVATVKGKDIRDVRISLGRDSRLSGPELLQISAEAISSTGASATDFELATTPAMFMSTILGEVPFDGAIMLTASHLPQNRNGLKFFTSQGGTGKADVKAILLDAADAMDARGGEPIPHSEANIEKQDFMATYSEHLVNIIRRECDDPEDYDRPLAGTKILVDAGNGAGGFFVHRVLNELGADTTGSQFLDPDGSFPNHVPNPEDKIAMKMTSEAVIKNAADLGVVFDTDVDRSGVVDAQGNEVNKNRLIAVVASIVLQEHQGTTIVTDSVTSNGLSAFIESKGGVHFRFKRGYKNVIDQGIELNIKGQDSQLSIETSGHGAMKENYMLDDGAYLAVKIIIELVRIKRRNKEQGVEVLYEGLGEPKEAVEYRIKFKSADFDFKSYGSKLLADLAEFGKGVSEWELEKVNYEGFRFSVAEEGGKAGWFLLRQSLHDPLLPLNVESEVEGGVQAIVSTLKPFLERYSELDLSVLPDA